MQWDLERDPFAAVRHDMVESQIRSRGIRDPRVLQALEKVPRHLFVRAEDRVRAYTDQPLALAEGQTISQPYIVAVTLAALAIQPTEIVLEIGTGSGYQTALLAEIAREVYSVERHASLASEAQRQLSQLGYRNITIQVGDGYQGLAEYAPYDAIVVSAAAPFVPPALLDQLRDGGRMVVPVGPPDAQDLKLVEKKQGLVRILSLGGCRFVPLVASADSPATK